MRKPTVISVVIIISFFVICAIIDMQFSTVSKHRIVKEKPKSKKPRTSLVFLKTHKCASTTVQNIIMRFGLKNQLNFVLPFKGNYLGNPTYFNKIMINRSIMPKNGKFDIFAHHTRYNYTSIKEIMKKNTPFVTILRDPADVIESLFTYYQNSFKRYNTSLSDVLIQPTNATAIKRTNISRFGLNQMLFDLGLEEEYFSSHKRIEEYIAKIDSEFDLVMISEYMEASVVLFANLMRWSLEDVVYLNLNARNISSRRILKFAERDILRKINSADWLLYTHFLDKFRNQINVYGKEKLLENVNKLISLNFKLRKDCVASINGKGYAQTISYGLRSNDWICIYATKSELPFTQELQAFQSDRLRIINKLTMFIYK